ncbi:MAG TPA: hypothetical protein VLY24_01570 [Bryobacteraceae bacterium]|nr:hypothetical protein [Bryobacteraceae bacterium]
MPIYGVIMRQGVTVDDLGNNTLITGYGNLNDTIQSCSAVMFFNTATRAAGLFHYPSGDLNRRRLRTTLSAMMERVQPNEAYIGYGVVGFIERPGLPADDKHTQLRTFILGLLPRDGGRLRRFPATSRVASISQMGGGAIIGSQEPPNITDLRYHAAANYNFGRIYWANE